MQITELGAPFGAEVTGLEAPLLSRYSPAKTLP